MKCCAFQNSWEQVHGAEVKPRMNKDGVKGRNMFSKWPEITLSHRLFRTLCALFFAVCTLPVLAAIPDTERAALIDFYNSTNGDSWYRNNNWKTGGNFSTVGTECTWYGVIC